jgi:hypothetical protein
MMMDNINAVSKLNAVFKYSENDATMSILSLHRDIGETFEIDLILSLTNRLNLFLSFFPVYYPSLTNSFFQTNWLRAICTVSKGWVELN